VKNRQVEPKEKVLNKWKRTLFLREEKEISAKGWLLDIMRSWWVPISLDTLSTL